MNTPIAENTGPRQRVPMITLTAARVAAKGPYTWIQIKPEGRDLWLDLADTKPVVAAQGFVSMEDEAEGNAYQILSRPKEEESEPLEADGVIFCPQAAMLLIQQYAEELPTGNGTPLELPAPEEARAWLKNYVATNPHL